VREIWDPNGEYKLYNFIRQAQVFPDVRLETTAPDVPEADRVLMGIELKGWFVLAKEGEPSFRYRASPAVCASQDLMVVYPWTLDEVVSGRPKLLRPFIEEARYAPPSTALLLDGAARRHRPPGRRRFRRSTRPRIRTRARSSTTRPPAIQAATSDGWRAAG